eukprot:1149521-Pyramimonas_sp.AAC.1
MLTETFECSDPGRSWEITRELMYWRHDARMFLRGTLRPEEMDEEDREHYQAAARKLQTLSSELASLWSHHMLTAVGLGSQATSVTD